MTDGPTTETLQKRSRRPARRANFSYGLGFAPLAGILYGWLKPGLQDKSQLLYPGLVFGLIVGVVPALFGYPVGSNPIAFGSGFVGLILGVVIITPSFILGGRLGDLVEGRPSKHPT